MKNMGNQHTVKVLTIEITYDNMKKMVNRSIDHKTKEGDKV